MKTLKYSTAHLTCYLAQDLKGQEHYQIFENGKNDKPIAIYIDCNHMQVANEMPKPETSYKYFDEMCEIVSYLYELETIHNEQYQ